MFGIGSYQPNLMYRDGIYGGLMATVSGFTVTVGAGLAIVGETPIENGSSGTAVTILHNSGTNYIYVNHPDALDANGAATATFDKTPEGNKTRTNVNGTTGIAEGRSIVLAKATATPDTATVTLTGTFAAADTVTTTIQGTAVVTTLDSTSAASLTAAAAAVAAAINANATTAAVVSATSALGVITLTAIAPLASAFTLSASDTAASGTATASSITAGTVTVDNTERLRLKHIPAAGWSKAINPADT